MDDQYAQKTLYIVNPVSPKSQSQNETSSLSDSQEIPFVRLLGGNEPEEFVETRWRLYNSMWKVQQDSIDDLLQTTHNEILNSADRFVRSPWSPHNNGGRLDTAILLAGSNLSSHMNLLSQIQSHVVSDTTALVSINSKDCASLKMALRAIIKGITRQDESAGASSFDQRLTYDLEILDDWCQRKVAHFNATVDNAQSDNRPINVYDLRVAVMIDDADSFEVPILTSLITMLHAYASAIPFKIILGVATSLEVFEEKLPRSLLEKLQVTRLQAADSKSARAMVDSIARDTLLLLYPGGMVCPSPKVMIALKERYDRSSASTHSFVSSLKYCYMSHFYANPFSALSGGDADQSSLKLTPEHMRAARMLPSFRTFVENNIEDEDSRELIQALLTDDKELEKIIFHSIMELNGFLCQLRMVVYVLNYLDQGRTSWLELYIMTLVGGLPLEEKITEALANREMLSDISQLQLLFNNFAEMFPTMTPVVLNPSSVFEQLRDFFLPAQVNTYKSYMLHEVFVMEVNKVQESAFMPRPRAAVEIALSNPLHYGISSPHICALYVLYRESPVFINIYDWYVAFKQTLGKITDDPDFDKMALSWFLQGVAELKLMGILRDSRRKFECVEKLTWRGL